MDSTVLSWLALREVEGIGDRLLLRLVAECGTPEQVFRSPASRLAGVEGISRETAGRILAQRDAALRAAEEHLRRAEKHGAGVLVHDDPRYPRLLKEIHDPPAFLYMKGNPELLAGERAFAVVGTRRATAYGKKMTRDIVEPLAQRGVLIVSGLARGIDSEAHETALEAGGATAGVMGCGMDTVYPPENKKLYADMAERGLLLSEFAPGTPPDAPNFPRRNRIIAGLCRGVLVVEASEKSGALITAELALESNREVFAVPGYATSPVSRGANALIRREKARLTESWTDVAEWLPALGLAAGSDSASPKVEFAAEEEKVIYEKLSFTDPVHIDRLAEATGYSISTLLTHLLALEIRDVVQQAPGKLFLRKA